MTTPGTQPVNKLRIIRHVSEDTSDNETKKHYFSTNAQKITDVQGREALGSLVPYRTQERTARKQRLSDDDGETAAKRYFSLSLCVCVCVCNCIISHLGFGAVGRAMTFPVTLRFFTNGFALRLFKVHKNRIKIEIKYVCAN